MNLLTPEREISAVPRCDRPVEGGGLMAYHCSLPQNHNENGPADDREPCYAVEVRPSTFRWSQWRERQNAREAADAPSMIVCPSCSENKMVVGRLGGECTGCGFTASFQEDAPEQPAEQAEPEQPPAPKQGGFRRVPPEELGDQGYAAEPVATVSTLSAPITCPYHPEMTVVPGAACPECGWPQKNDQDVVDEIGHEMYPAPGAPDIPGITDLGHQTISTDIPSDSVTVRHEGSGVTASYAPTKQRDGDQRLPAGGDRVVQDHRIAEESKRIGLDAQIVAGIMEESKRVGISRYGQPLHTFDGRKNIRDLADELRDALVYVTKLQMTAEADRETLVRMVTQAIAKQWYEEAQAETEDSPEGFSARMAEVAVDRILDWVLVQKIGTDQVAPVPDGTVE